MYVEDVKTGEKFVFINGNSNIVYVRTANGYRRNNESFIYNLNVACKCEVEIYKKPKIKYEYTVIWLYGSNHGVMTISAVSAKEAAKLLYNSCSDGFKRSAIIHVALKKHIRSFTKDNI